MEAVFEILFQIIFEIVLEVISQILVELGFAAMVEPFRNKFERNPILASVGYILFGLILGGLSLLIFPEPIIKSKVVRLINFTVSPILLGFFLCLFSRLTQRQTIGERFFRIEKFILGFLFALSYSLVRFVVTK